MFRDRHWRSIIAECQGVFSFRLVYPILKEIDEPAHPLITSLPQSSMLVSSNGQNILSERENGSSSNEPLQSADNSEGTTFGSLETLVEEGEIMESSDHQVDSTRRLVERGLVL